MLIAVRARPPVPQDKSTNPIGPAIAAIAAVSEAFRTELIGPPVRTLLNGLTWGEHIVTSDSPRLSATGAGLGNVWIVGVGSVGTAILYFLALATRKFRPTLFDGDIVKVHNLDRSPIFCDVHVGRKKVDVTKSWLAALNVAANAEPFALHESETWRDRQSGVPDILVSAANEHNVRSIIESGFPPLQVYGTTGSNWQAALIRHMPFRDPCSRCLFVEDDQQPTLCATGGVRGLKVPAEERVDAALPFLSFAAGAMAAAEILKLDLPGYPFSTNRVLFNTLPRPRLVSVPLRTREDCLCCHRSDRVHREMIGGSRYWKP